MIASALLYAVLSSGEVDADYVPSWFCELVVDELQAGSKVELVALNGDILPGFAAWRHAGGRLL